MMPRWIALLALTASALPAETNPEIRELVRRSLAGLNQEDEKTRRRRLCAPLDQHRVQQ
jgi:hypothetical protein